MKPRHIAKFKTTLTTDELLSWFSSELLRIDPAFVINQSKTKYQHNISISLNESEMSYSVAEDPREGGYIIYSEPKLKFMGALFGKPDTKQHEAIKLAHQILSNSQYISDLGWLLSQQAWKTPKSTP